MDPVVIKALADNGLTGVLIAVIVLLHWHTVKVQIPSILASFKEEIASEREDCRTDRALDRSEHKEAVGGIYARLDRIENKIK